MTETNLKYRFFKIFNNSHFELISPKTFFESSNEYYYEYEFENNLQLKNEFYEDQLCFSSVDNIVELKYLVFVQKIKCLMEEHYYENVDFIQKSVIENIGYTFFKDENSTLKNIRKLKINDIQEIFSQNLFEKVILPNIKINLIKHVDLNEVPNIGYTVAYNFDYFYDINRDMNNNLIVYRPFMYRNNKFESLIDAKNKILFDLWVLTNSTDFFSASFLFPKDKYYDEIKSKELFSIMYYSSTDYKSDKELIYYSFKFEANKSFYKNEVTEEQITSQFMKLESVCKILNIKPFKIL